MATSKIVIEKGDRYGFLVFTGNKFHDSIQRRMVGEFICDCGQIIRTRLDRVVRGNPNSCGCKSRAYNYVERRNKLGEDYPFYILFKKCLKRAKKTNLEITITASDLKHQYDMQNGKCFYTHQEIILPLSFTSKSSDISNLVSVDRTDSSKGYIVGNIQLTTKTINILKLNYTHEEFLDICHTIASNFPTNKL